MSELDPELELTVSTEDSTGGDTQTQEPDNGFNPAWAPIRDDLDPVSFQRVQKHLKDMDSAANQRITSVNEQFKWAKDLNQEKVNAALTLADSLDSDPYAIWEKLGQFLRDNGRMPENQQELDEGTEDEDGDEDDDSQEDPRFAQLAAQQEKMQQFLEHQEQQREQEKANQQVASELQQLEETRKDLSREDIGQILQHAASQTGVSGKIVTLQQATQWFDGLRNRILTAPRPGDSAPELLPTSGGVPPATTGKSPSEMTSAEIQALVAGSLTARNGR